ncbi:putative transcription factor WD40-like family [Medicago truncatula]|uniref:Putative transcription factor WD40-like family n=1 Tax=Medicago truncatula TaxID=3880 RepID=A0A072VPK7_MEDTR|nr:angio-associated migratory cell protein [Medicago truncatula]KEH43596.1 vegetative incompatibility HET-E-like protein [Medicago truncatula]RHN81597.1 putative transcription factor WD40-like family [Medicago truncatula]
MSDPNHHSDDEFNNDEDEDNNDVFIDDSDIIHEVASDDELLPDAPDDNPDGPGGSPGPDGGGGGGSGYDDDSVHTFTGHEGELYTVACSPTDEALVATGAGDDVGFLWRILNGEWASQLNGHKDSVSSLGFSHDGTFLASGSFDGTVKIWDASGNLKGTLDGPEGGVEWLRWHPRGNVLIAGFDESSSVWMWNSNLDFLMSFNGHAGSVTCGDFTPDGRTICTGSDDATLRIWNPKSGESIHVVRGHPYHTEGITCLAINSTSTIALTGSVDGSVHIVNITTGRVVSTLPSHSSSIECVGFAPSGSWAAIGGMDKMTIWDVEHSLARSICEHEYGVTCSTWLGTSYVATGSNDGAVRLWDSRSGECVRTFRGHSESIQSLSLSANQEYLVSASLDHTARVFDVKGVC